MGTSTKQNIWIVYILKCADGKHYTGCTSNLSRRLRQHNSGESTYTSTRRPVTLITYITLTDKYKAYKFEKYLKSGSGHAFARKRLA